MKLSDTFLPTAGVVGLLPVVTYFFLVVTMYAFLATFIFSVATQSGINPKYRTLHILTIVIAAVAGISYFLIQGFYHNLLAELATLADPDNRRTLIRESYSGISQYRSMDWAVTTPLLLISMILLLGVKLSDIKRPLVLLLLADLFMIFTGFIGEQQLSFDNEILIGPKLIWGAVSTVGYVYIPFTLYRFWQQFGSRALPLEQQAYKLIAMTTVTFWGIYPIGYILTVFDIDMNWIHIAFAIADVINKIGVALVVYWVSREKIQS